MARMHSRKKGKSGSTKPSKKRDLAWIKYKGKEVELLIAKLAKEGKTPSQIGMDLRDTYGIPDSKDVTGKTITHVMHEKKLLPALPEDLMALIKKSLIIKKHMGTNRKDMTALRGKQLTETKIRRLVKHYKVTKRLPEDWKYEPERIRLLIE